MPSDSHRHRGGAKPQGPKCVQCDKEPRDLARPDKLGRKCGIWADRGAAKAKNGAGEHGKSA